MVLHERVRFELIRSADDAVANVFKVGIKLIHHCSFGRLFGVSNGHKDQGKGERIPKSGVEQSSPLLKRGEAHLAVNKAHRPAWYLLIRA